MKLSELLSGKWTGQNKWIAESISFITEKFNNLAFWTACCILFGCENRVSRMAKLIEKFVLILEVKMVRSAWYNEAQNLREMNDFQNMGAIISGLNLNAIHRLTNVWKVSTSIFPSDWHLFVRPCLQNVKISFESMSSCSSLPIILVITEVRLTIILNWTFPRFHISVSLRCTSCAESA